MRGPFAAAPASAAYNPYTPGLVKRWANNRCVAFGGYASARDDSPRASVTTGFGWCD